MPVTTRASSERESDSLDQAEAHEVADVGNEPSSAEAESSASQGAGTAAGGEGEATSTPARLAARAIAAARGLVAPQAPLPTTSTATTFSQVHDYIDVTCPSTSAAYRFFGWLLPAAMRA